MLNETISAVKFMLMFICFLPFLMAGFYLISYYLNR